MVLGKLFVLKVPFQGVWDVYVENFCFVEDTYFVGIHEELPHLQNDKERRFYINVNKKFFYKFQIFFKIFYENISCH